MTVTILKVTGTQAITLHQGPGRIAVTPGHTPGCVVLTRKSLLRYWSGLVAWHLWQRWRRKRIKFHAVLKL